MSFYGAKTANEEGPSFTAFLLVIGKTNLFYHRKPVVTITRQCRIALAFFVTFARSQRPAQKKSEKF